MLESHLPGIKTQEFDLDWIPAAAQQDVLLSVRDLSVEFHTSRGTLRAVENVSYDVRRGEILALVGESGCGKSVSSLAVMRLLPKRTSRIVSGSIMFEGRDLLTLNDEDMREIRGRDIAMIFQEPMTSLNPVLTIGFQIMESLFIHMNLSPLSESARHRAVAARRHDRPGGGFSSIHQLSAACASALIAIGCLRSGHHRRLPTTALDVTIQAQILELLKDLSERLNIAVILITHNLGIVARYAHRVNVMYAARLVETGTASDVFLTPKHPYTMGLMRSVPRLDRPRGAKLATIEGLPPDLRTPPTGCRFAPRCAISGGVCVNALLSEQEPGHYSACWHARELASTPPFSAMAP
jgi:peptide/nickel transport system ATP-binding protein